jgi:hypothetical protein
MDSNRVVWRMRDLAVPVAGYGGVAIAEGTHASLVRDDPLYRRLAALQFGLETASVA